MRPNKTCCGWQTDDQIAVVNSESEVATWPTAATRLRFSPADEQSFGVFGDGSEVIARMPLKFGGEQRLPLGRWLRLARNSQLAERSSRDRRRTGGRRVGRRDRTSGLVVSWSAAPVGIRGRGRWPSLFQRLEKHDSRSDGSGTPVIRRTDRAAGRRLRQADRFVGDRLCRREPLPRGCIARTDRAATRLPHRGRCPRRECLRADMPWVRVTRIGRRVELANFFFGRCRTPLSGCAATTGSKTTSNAASSFQRW